MNENIRQWNILRNLRHSETVKYQNNVLILILLQTKHSSESLYYMVLYTILKWLFVQLKLHKIANQIIKY